MQNFDHNATKFSAKNALLLAQLCNAAYGTETEARSLTGQMGFPDFEWVDLEQPLENTSALIVGCDDFAAIAFCGTKNLKNWMTDLHSTPGRFAWFFRGAPDIGEVPRGLRLRPPAFLGKNRGGHEPCPATGGDPGNYAGRPFHQTAKDSLDRRSQSRGRTGRARRRSLSVLPGGIIRPVGGVYTFGQPRIGLHNFCEAYDHLLAKKTFRFINREDLVPRVPFRGWNYADLGQMIHFDSPGTPRRESREWNNFLARTFEGFTDSFKSQLTSARRWPDHSRTGYEQLVRIIGRARCALCLTNHAKKRDGKKRQFWWLFLRRSR